MAASGLKVSSPCGVRCLQTKHERQNEDAELDVGLWSMLDDHLLEKIIARELVGYGSISKKWWRLPSHSYVQEDVVMDSALWGGTTKKRRGRDKNHPDWTLRGRRTCSQEWDSSDIIPEDVVYHKLAMGGEAVKDGLLYMLVYTMAARSEYSLISFDVKQRIWKEIRHLAPREVVGHPTLGVCHGDCIYMGDSSSSSRFGAYNVETREWHCVDSPSDILPSLSGSEQFCGLCLSDCSWDWHPFLWRFVAGIYKPAFNPVLEV
ncbi:unnamed protein product [Calypogeia fissa]